MKQRPKLDLAGHPGKEKHQAMGFDQVADVSPDPGAAPAHEAGARAPESAAKSHYMSKLFPDPATRKLIIKTVAVVGVAALAVFLLKRR